MQTVPTDTPVPDPVLAAAQIMADYNLGHPAPADSVAQTATVLRQLLAKCSYNNAADVAQYLISTHTADHIAANHRLGIKTFTTQIAQATAGNPPCTSAINSYIAILDPQPTAIPSTPIVSNTSSGNGSAADTSAQPAGQYHASASVSNPSPGHNERVTVYGKLTDASGHGVAGAALEADWYYKSTTSICTGGPTSANGAAACTRDISRATYGYTVEVDVIFTLPDGTTVTASTSFTPQ